MKQYVGHLKHALRAPIIGLYNDVHSLPIHPLILEGSINAKFGFVALLRARTWLTAGHVTFSWRSTNFTTRWQGSARLFKGRQRKSMEKWEIDPQLPQKPLKRSSPKFAWVIMSWTPYLHAKFHPDTINSFCSPPPKICEIAYIVTLLVLLVLPSAYSQHPCTDFHDQYVKWRRFTQGCAFWGSRKQNFTFRPHSPSPKTQIFGQFSTGLRKFCIKKALMIDYP